jgi:hypothetical protein
MKEEKKAKVQILFSYEFLQNVLGVDIERFRDKIHAMKYRGANFTDFDIQFNDEIRALTMIGPGSVVEESK